jgi:hypothetical protein
MILSYFLSVKQFKTMLHMQIWFRCHYPHKVPNIVQFELSKDTEDNIYSSMFCNLCIVYSAKCFFLHEGVHNGINCVTSR